MKIQLLILLSCLSSFGGFAQVPTEVLWGPDNQQPKHSKPVLAGVGPEGFYVCNVSLTLRSLLLGGPRFDMEFYGHDLKLKKRHRFDLTYKSITRQYRGLLYIKGSLFLYTSSYDGRGGKQVFYSERLDLITLQSKGDVQIVAEVPTNGPNNYASIRVDVSRDSSKIMLFVISPTDKNEQDKFEMYVFDKQMQELWTQKVEVPYLDKLFALRDVKVANNGDVFFSGKLYESRAQKRARKAEDPEDRSGYRFSLFSYRRFGTEQAEYKLDLGEDFISEFGFELGPDAVVLCAGFYSERASSGAKGTFTFSVDPESREATQKQIYPFPREFMVELIGQRRADKGKEAYSYNMDHLIPTTDGGMVLVGEQFFVTTSSTYVNGQWVSRTYYNYMDIIVLRLNPDGSIGWYQKVDKYQRTSGGTEYASYQLMVVDDKLHFLYNDHADNLTTNEPTTIRNFVGGRKATVALVSVDFEGNETRRPLLLSKAVGVFIQPVNCVQINSREMLLYADKRKTYRYARLRFE